MQKDTYKLGLIATFDTAKQFFVTTAKESLNDLKESFLYYKPYATTGGLILALTSLFLNINGQDPFLRRIQALLLLVSTIPIGIMLVGSAKILSRKRHSELYRAFALLFIFLTGLFLINLFGYLFTSFNQELLYYLKWLGIPIIALSTNVLLILCFRLIRRYHAIEGWGLENFFLLILDLNLAWQYSRSGMDFLQTLKRITSFEFHNILILYLFFLSVLIEIRLVGKVTTKRRLIFEGILMSLLAILPFAIYYLS